jgi:hypothetical protein
MRTIDTMLTEATQPDARPEQTAGGLVFGTPNSITAFGLFQLRAVLRLESLGLKRRGMSAVTQAKRLGLKGRTAAALREDLTARMVAAGMLTCAAGIMCVDGKCSVHGRV